MQQQNDMTVGSIRKKMLLFAFPILIGQVFQQLYNTIDSLIVGCFLGDHALAAVSSSGSLIFMMVGFFQGVALGAGIIIAKEFGAKHYDRMRRTIHTDVAFGIAAGILLTVLGVFLTPQILRWMQTPAEVLPQSVLYFRVYFCGSLFSILYNIFVGILQATGDSRHPLYYLIVSSIINVILDFLFVGVLGMGVGAAALATIIAQFISAVLCLVPLFKLPEEYRFRIREIGFDKASLKDIVRFGLPSGIQNSVIALANLVVQSNINTFGADAMAGCGAYFKLEGFAFLPVTCFAQGLSTFVGQNLGAKQFDRVKKGVRFGVFCSMIMTEAIGLCFWINAPFLIGLFTTAPQVAAFGVTQAHIETLFYCMLALAHCIAGIMRGAGKPTVPMFIMLGFWCVLRVTYITTALYLFHDIRIIFSAYPMTWCTSCVAFVLYYKKADWIHTFEKLEKI